MPEAWPPLLRGLHRKQEEDNGVRGKGWRSVGKDWGLGLDKELIRPLADGAEKQNLLLGPLEGA